MLDGARLAREPTLLHHNSIGEKNMFLDLTLAIEMHDPVVGKANQDQNSFMSQGHIGTHLDV
jgi:kynurenine formamidase